MGWSTIRCVCCISDTVCTKAACLGQAAQYLCPAVTRLWWLSAAKQWLPTSLHAFTLWRLVHQRLGVSMKAFLQADNVLKGKPGSGSQSRGGQGAKFMLFDSFARYLSFVHFAVFCLLSLLKAVVSSHHNILQPRQLTSDCLQAASASKVLAAPHTLISAASPGSEQYPRVHSAVDSTALSVPILTCLHHAFPAQCLALCTNHLQARAYIYLKRHHWMLRMLHSTTQLPCTADPFGVMTAALPHHQRLAFLCCCYVCLHLQCAFSHPESDCLMA